MWVNMAYEEASASPAVRTTAPAKRPPQRDANTKSLVLF